MTAAAELPSMSRTLLYPPTCRWNTADGRCGEPQARPYPGGYRCDSHSPWAQAGQPEPITPTEAARRKEQQ